VLQLTVLVVRDPQPLVQLATGLFLRFRQAEVEAAGLMGKTITEQEVLADLWGPQ
jgi:hypothetical protein